MPNVGKNYPDEIAQLKRTKAKYGLSNADIEVRCAAYCMQHPDLTPASPSTIAKIFAAGSESATFTYKTIQPIIAVLSDMDKDTSYQADDAALYFEQVQTLTLAVEEKNKQIADLEKKVAFFRSQYERAMSIIEALTKK